MADEWKKLDIAKLPEDLTRLYDFKSIKLGENEKIFYREKSEEYIHSFNQRKKLSQKYYEWLHSRNGLVDCPENVMAFLDAEGYFRNKPVEV